MNRHHTDQQAIHQEVLSVLKPVLLVLLVLVVPEVLLLMNQPASQQVVVLMLVSLVVLLVVLLVLVVLQQHMKHLLVVMMLQQLAKQPTTQLTLMPHGHDMVLKYVVLVSLLTPTHKLFDELHQVVFKHTHKTSKFAFFNHHQSQPQAHSSLKKCAHHNHQFHPHFASVNKLHLSHNLLHSFFVKDHHNHQQLLLHKQLFANLLLYPYHHDQSSLNDYQLLQPDHVISSLNVGFHMVLLLNEKPLFNVLKQLKVMLHHAMSSFNTNQFKFVLFVNSNA